MAASGSRLPMDLPPQRQTTSQRELIVRVNSKAALRVSPTGMTAVDTPFLNSFAELLKKTRMPRCDRYLLVSETE